MGRSRYPRRVGAVPDLQLLADGDILVPVREAGAWRVERLQPSDTDYAGWLAESSSGAHADWAC